MATLVDKVCEAIRTQQNPKGSSLQYIKKHLKAEYDLDNAVALKKATK